MKKEVQKLETDGTFYKCPTCGSEVLKLIDVAEEPCSDCAAEHEDDGSDFENMFGEKVD